VGEKVAIYCGYGPGIILRLFKFVDRQIPGGPNGWHTERIAEETARVEIAGGAAALRGQPAQKPGFARTVIDKSFWTEWLQGPGKDNSLVKAGLLFAVAASDAKRGRDQARDHSQIATGLEPLDAHNVVIGQDESGRPLHAIADKRWPRNAARGGFNISSGATE